MERLADPGADMVTPTRAASIRISIARTVLWAVAAVIVSAVGLRELMRAQETTAARGDAALLVTRIVAAQLGTGAANLPEAVRRLTSHPAVLGAAMLSSDGVVTAATARRADVESVLRSDALRLNECRHVRFWGAAGQTPVTAQLVDVPIVAEERPSSSPAAATAPVLRLLVCPPASGQPWYDRLWLSCAPLLAVGALGSLIGTRRLERQVLDPLYSLTQLARDPSAAGSDLSHHPPEVHEVAQALLALRNDRNEWRARAQHTERAVETKIAQKTQAIYRELRRAKQESLTDALTGLYNRRAMGDRLEAIFEAQRDAEQDLSVIMIDVDHFKLLNDTLGHPCGDELLKFTADLLRSGLRANDLAVRYGGDEFMLLLPAVSVEEAAAIARRLVALFRQRAVLLPGLAQRPSLSVGVASLNRSMPASALDLVASADRALYRAKAAGREEVAVFDAVHDGGSPVCGAGSAAQS